MGETGELPPNENVRIRMLTNPQHKSRKQVENVLNVKVSPKSFDYIKILNHNVYYRPAAPSRGATQN